MPEIISSYALIGFQGVQVKGTGYGSGSHLNSAGSSERSRTARWRIRSFPPSVISTKPTDFWLITTIRSKEICSGWVAFWQYLPEGALRELPEQLLL